MTEEKSKGLLSQLEDYLVSVSKKLPALPGNAKDVIAKITPWIILILMILFIPAIIAIFSIGSAFRSVALIGGIGFVGYSTMYYITFALSAVTFILEIVAIKGLFARKISAWRLLFYATLVNALSNLLSLSIVSLIISAAISLYLLFQIRELYKD